MDGKGVSNECIDLKMQRYKYKKGNKGNKSDVVFNETFNNIKAGMNIYGNNINNLRRAN